MKRQSATGRRFNFWGFSSQVFLGFVLPVTALILIVAIGSQSLHHDAMRSLVGDRDLKIVRAAANSLELEIMHLSATIQTLGRETGSRTDFSGLTFSSAELAASFDGGIALFSSSRQFIQASPPADFWSSLPDSQGGYFDAVRAARGQPVFSAAFSVAGSAATYILAGTATGAGNILVGAFTPASLARDTLSGFVGSGQITALVISRRQVTDASSGQAGGTGFDVLYSAGPLRQDEHVEGHPGFENSLNGESGINYFHSSEGEHVVAFSAIAPVGWGLVMEEAWEDIASPYLNSTQAAPLAVIPAFLLAVAALWFGARRIIRPLQDLEKQAAELGEGNFDAIQKPVGGIAEIRNLQAELIEMANKLKSAEQSLHSYIGVMTAGVENERRSLARELHDDTIQSLIALNQRIQLAARKTPNPQETGAKELAELQGLVQQAMTNLRRIIRGLRPIYLEDLGLAASLEMLARESGQAGSIQIAFNVQGEQRRLDPQVEMSLYRMVQESLNNVIRHSQASQAGVHLSFTEDELRIEIRDDGTGFNVPANLADYSKTGHFGLLGLLERAEIIAADLKVSSKQGQGTSISITLKTSGTSLAGE
jgi:signal transduction histidine kinase